jgi:thioredoxin reductase (NADPH)
MQAGKEEMVIVGGGPAGYTAAIYAARAGRNPLLLTEPRPGGQE